MCARCPSNCKTCTSMYCDSCEEWYWGVDCQHSCLGCFGTCDKSRGCINGCRNGYYFMQQYYSKYFCETCPENCISCSSSNECLSCHTGFNGSICQHDCRECNGRFCKASNGECTIRCSSSQFYDTMDQTCEHCPTGCIRCTSSSCDTCVNGKWGENCQNHCSINCQSQTCDKITGHCTHCIDGFHGDFCSFKCMENCISCVDDTNCLICKDGFFNSASSNICSCNNRSCVSMIDGICQDCSSLTLYPSGIGCCPCSSDCQNNECYPNQTCLECYDGKHGPYCSNECHILCRDKLCHRNGECLSCVDGRYGQDCTGYCYSHIWYCQKCKIADDNSVACESCPEGYYLINNSCKACYANCLYGGCNSTTGYCLYGCHDNWFGDRCDSPCNVSYCQDCPDDVNLCKLCNAGFYLSNLSCISCPEKCRVENECDRSNGSCIDGCTDGWSGPLCDKSCFSHCDQCDQLNDSICGVCKFGFYGTGCEKTCSQNCNSSYEHQTCNKTTGMCFHGCREGFWGPTCHNLCGSGCSGSICNITNGKCFKECINDFYGDTCNLVCSNSCYGKDNRSFGRICDLENGRCLHGCTNGWYGESCTEQCSENCVQKNCFKKNGTCALGCVDGYTGYMCFQAEESGYQASKMAAAIGVGAGTGVSILVVIAIVFAFLLQKRRNQSKFTSHGSEVIAENQDAEPWYSNIEDSRIPIGTAEVIGVSNQLYANTTVRMTDISEKAEQTDTIILDRQTDFLLEENIVDGELIEVEEPGANTDDDKTYYNIGGKRVQVTKLEEYVQHKRANEMIEEFNKIPKGLLKSYKEAKKSNNVAKNKYRTIYPYDVTRVILSDGGSDYINASYIEGYNKPKEYIASSGPFCKSYDTTPDFWRMIWQEKCKTLVMLTNPIEHKEVKCVKYWPDLGCSRDFEDIHVTCLAEDIYSDFTIRVLASKKGSETLNIRHLHFTAWPDKSVPHDVTSMIEFRQKVRSLHKQETCVMIVHCSAGIGRTGTFILLDMLTCEGEDRGSVDIFGSVASLRYQRCNMVQTSEQYMYLHHAVLHSLTFDCRSIPGGMFLQNYNKLLERNGGRRIIDKQFQQLLSITEETTNDEKAEIERNKAMSEKNRKCADVPCDENRVRLDENRKPGASDYINAVYINSFRRRRKLIVAQTPLASTVVDFLSLIQQERCLSVVSMEEADLEDKTVKVYWPADNQVVKHGVFKLSCKESQTTNHYVLKKLTMTYHGPQMGEETRDLNLFIFTKWPKGEQVPNTPDSLCELVRLVDVENRSSGSEPPILVHCKTGAERSCLYCAVSILIEKMEVDNEVSVVNTLRQIKARRRSAISSIEQYKFCYQAVISYLQSFETYSNFGPRDSSTV